MKRMIDLKSWKRREHYLFFRRFNDPFYDVTVHFDMTAFSRNVKESGAPLFLSYLYASLKAVHQIPAFRLRIENDKVVEFDRVAAGPAIERPDGTFGFSRIAYDEDFNAFCKKAREETERVKMRKDLHDDSNELDVVYYSTLPWFGFTGLTQPRMNVKTDSVPKIVFGRIEENNGRYRMAAGIQVNHALVDGRDIGDYCKVFQTLLDQ
jgi:chloramphenicol O-acetyltransferase type A